MSTLNPFIRNSDSKSSTKTNNFFILLVYTLKWLGLCLLVGFLAGTASAWFLLALAEATTFRENNLWIITLLPLGGILIAALYKYFGKEVIKGNNQLIEEIQKPRKIVPLAMAPLIFFGTVATHLFGGSAGREGSAVQMGGSIADQFTRLFNLKKRDRRILLMCGISAGFASVFGTPLAGAVFALEVFIVGSLVYEAILPSFLAAVIAHYTCLLWGAHHSHYHIENVPEINIPYVLLAIVAGILFGLTGRLFSKANHFSSSFFKKYISNDLLRPVGGALIVMAFVWLWGGTEFIGLGLPTISASFEQPQPFYSFLIKLILTAITLGAGFKGGEVTPLFFVGATLGSFLSLFMPLPVDLLAGMGFVAVFTAAANTPLACILMGIELFGAAPAMYIAIACVMAYLFSGHSGIYASQIIGSPKHGAWAREKGANLRK